jgi:hypothetical protein
MFKFYDYVIVISVLIVSLSVSFVPRLLKRLRVKLAKKGRDNKSKSSSNAAHYVVTNDDYEDEFSIHYASGSLNKKPNAADTNAQKKQKPHFLMNSISFVVSFQTTVSIIGLPIEYYYYGFKTTQFLFSFLLGPFIIAGLFVPFLFKIKSKSIYEYLDDKFEGYKTVKNFTLLMIMMYQFLLASLVLLSAGITVAQIVSSNYQLSLWPIVLVLGLISSSLALLGFHSVVWLNFIQYLIMIACNLTIIYLGVKHFTFGQANSQSSLISNSTSASNEFSDGLSRVWSSTVQSGRDRLFVFDENLRYRFTFWNGLIGTTFNLIPTYALTQQSYMRIKSCKSVNSARLLVLTMIPFGIINLLLIILLGFVMYAYFHVCGDPRSAGLIKNQNQIFTKFLTQFFGQYNGLLGVYIALIISNSIGTLANTLKALSVILSEDVFIRLIKKYTNELSRSVKSSNGLENGSLNGSGGGLSQLPKENSIYRLRRLSEKNVELSYEEELLTFEYHSNFKRQHKKLIKNYKKNINKEQLIKKRLNLMLILICCLIIIVISLALEMAPNTLTSTSFSLLNATHGPVLFVYLCAIFNDRLINSNKYASVRTGVQANRHAAADFRLKHYEVVISCILAIIVIEFMFIGQIATYKQANEFYNFDKYPISRVENPNEQLIEFCRYEENDFKSMSPTLLISSSSSSSSIKDNDRQSYFFSLKNNTTSQSYVSVEQESNSIAFFNYLFATSFNWYPLIGFLVCLVSLFLLTLLRVISRYLFFRIFKINA